MITNDAVVLGILILTGLGKKRGSRLHKARIRLWSTIIGLSAAGGFLAVTLTGCPPPTCYKPALPPEDPTGQPQPEAPPAESGDGADETDGAKGEPGEAAPAETGSDEVAAGNEPPPDEEDDAPPPPGCYKPVIFEESK